MTTYIISLIVIIGVGLLAVLYLSHREDEKFRKELQEMRHSEREHRMRVHEMKRENDPAFHKPKPSSRSNTESTNSSSQDTSHINNIPLYTAAYTAASSSSSSSCSSSSSSSYDSGSSYSSSDSGSSSSGGCD